ncbi:hypothetical protein, partial [Tessaracoccus massiliensis]|uniref:hypothetical protein n=1 Tax=Tessaracoccus massiliensis TaxID=1522311 RepID=UPI001C5A4BB5
KHAASVRPEPGSNSPLKNIGTNPTKAGSENHQPSSTLTQKSKNWTYIININTQRNPTPNKSWMTGQHKIQNHHKGSPAQCIKNWH